MYGCTKALFLLLVSLLVRCQEQQPVQLLNLPIAYRETSVTAPLISRNLLITSTSNAVADVTNICIVSGLDDALCSAVIAEAVKELSRQQYVLSSEALPTTTAANDTILSVQAHPYLMETFIVQISHLLRCTELYFMSPEDITSHCNLFSLPNINCIYLAYDIRSYVYSASHCLSIGAYISSMPLPDASNSVSLTSIYRIVNDTLISLPPLTLVPIAYDPAVDVAAYCAKYELFRDECKMILRAAAVKLVHHFGMADNRASLSSLQLLSLFINVLDEAASIDDQDSVFIEVGMSDFNTLLQLVDEGEDMKNSYAIEPLRIYTNLFSARNGVTLLNIALGGNTTSTIPIYYIPPTAIAEHRLPAYLKGCNSIFKPHAAHASLLQHVVVEHVPLVSVEDFMIAYDIQHIRLLKIDAEGADFDIIKGLLEYYQSRDISIDQWVDIIVFESSSVLHEVAYMIEVVDRWIAAGYYIASRPFTGDTMLHKRMLRHIDRHLFRSLLLE